MRRRRGSVRGAEEVWKGDRRGEDDGTEGEEYGEEVEDGE